MKKIIKGLIVCGAIISHLFQGILGGVLWAAQPHQVGISLVKKNGYLDLSIKSSFDRGTLKNIRIENSRNDIELRGKTKDSNSR